VDLGDVYIEGRRLRRLCNAFEAQVHAGGDFHTADIGPVAVYHVKGRRGAEIDNNQGPHRKTDSCPGNL